MRTLRVLAAAPLADAACAWALVDERGGVVERGTGAPAQWPAAPRREAVLAASGVRIVALALPPLPPARVTSAASYALEERLATPMEASVVVAGPQDADGRVVALVVPRALARSLASHAPAFDRIVAEPQCARPPAADAWRWCASQGHGFVVTGAGEAFAVGGHGFDDLPPELRVALEQAARSGRAPLRVVASVPGAAASRDAWTRATGVPFAAAPAWDWAVGDADPADDLAPALARALAPSEPARAAPTFRLAAMLAVAAFALHVVATAGTWAWRKVEVARTHAAIAEAARAAGAADAADIARRHAQALHRAGRSVPQDAWPLLARAAPAIAALPPATLRSARYGGSAWTLDLAALDDAALASFDARLRSAGVAAVAARNASGVRMRLEVAG